MPQQLRRVIETAVVHWNHTWIVVLACGHWVYARAPLRRPLPQANELWRCARCERSEGQEAK